MRRLSRLRYPARAFVRRDFPSVFCCGSPIVARSSLLPPVALFCYSFPPSASQTPPVALRSSLPYGVLFQATAFSRVLFSFLTAALFCFYFFFLSPTTSPENPLKFSRKSV